MSKIPKKRFKFTQKQSTAQNADSGIESENHLLKDNESEPRDSAPQGVNYSELTNIELARIIKDNGFSERAESTLNRLSKDELIFIIKNQSDESLERVSKANVETANDIIGAVVDLLDEVHLARNGETNKESLKKFTQKQSVAISPYLNSLAYTNFGLFALGVGVALLTIDSFYGFDRVGRGLGFKKQVIEVKSENK